MRAFVAIALLAVIAVAEAQTAEELQQSGHISVRAYTDPADDVWFAQQTRLYVEVRTRTWFTEAPLYPELKLDGAIAIQPAGFSTNLSERIGGQTYVIQRRTYLVFPQRVGELRLPAITVRFGTSVDGQASDSLSLTTEPVSVNVLMPPGADELEQLVTTPNLRVSETVDGNLAELETGDAVTRTIEMRGTDTLALVLPRIDFADIDGMSVYPAQPQLSDTTNRGAYSGTRVDSATYILEQAGTFELPAVSIYWWDPDTETLETEQLDAIELRVAQGPAQATGSASEGSAESEPGQWLAASLGWLRNNIITISFVMAIGYVVLVLLRKLVPPAMQRRHERRRLFLASEEHYFRQFQKACDGGRSDAARATFWAWLDRVDGISTVTDLAIASRMPEIKAGWDALAATRYGGEGDVSNLDVGKLSRDLAEARQRLLAKNSNWSTMDSKSLNPRPKAA